MQHIRLLLHLYAELGLYGERYIRLSAGYLLRVETVTILFQDTISCMDSIVKNGIQRNKLSSHHMPRHALAVEREADSWNRS